MAINRRQTLAALLATSAATLPIGLAFAKSRDDRERRAPGDYMSVALRREVEKLKTAVAAEPTNDSNYADRGLVLYDWMNAMSLTGTYLHPDIPALIAALYTPGFLKTGDRARKGSLGSVDRFVRTLAAQEKNPHLVGTVTATTEGPLKVDSHVEFKQTYTVGDGSIRVGGGLVLPNHFYFASAELQTSDPKADNYVSLRMSNPDVEVALDSYPIAGMFSSTLGITEAPRVFFRLTKGELQKGDTMTVTYGDRSGGSRGLQLIHISNSSLRFPFWLMTEADGILLTPREAVLPIYGGPVAGVHGFVPSIVAVGETFTVSIRAEDKFRNLATGGAPAWTITLNGAPFRTLAASSNAIAMLKDVKLTKPGTYRFGFVSADGKIRGKSDPVLVEANPAERVYWGETHGHCGFSEGMGLIDNYFEFARDESRLDFVTLSEHDLWLDAGEWEQMRAATHKFNRPGEFVTFLGYEWTVVSAYGGHHNVIFRDVDGVQPVTCQRHPTLPDLYAGLRKSHAPADVLVIPHAHMTADATVNDKDLEPLVEIVSEHGTFDWLGRRYLANGFQLGFIGAGDDHIGHPGYKPKPLGRYYFDGYGGLAAVYASTKQRGAIFDAMKSRRTYATNGARIILKTSLNGRHMGEVVPSATARSIEGAVHGTAPIESITLVKNGREHRTLSYDATEANGRDDIVEVRFASSSDPARLLVPARAARAWVGKIIVEGAAIASVSSPQAEALNDLTEWARPSAATVDQIDFRLVTRGDSKAIRLYLKGDLATARVRIVLAEARTPLDKIVAVPAAGAPPATLDAPDADPGGVRNTGGAFTDHIAVRRIRPATEMDREFRFADDEKSADGDYYYVRVVQADGGTAWSSPGWVGDVPKRVGDLFEVRKTTDA